MDSTQQSPVLTVGSKVLTVPGGNSQTLAPASHQRWLSNHEFPHPLSRVRRVPCLGNSGVLSLFTDDEVAVGSVFYHLGVGKDVRVTRASPQSQEMNGRAERSVRMVKENVLCVSEELKSQGLEPCWDEEKQLCLCLNTEEAPPRVSSFPASAKAPKPSP